MNDFQNILFQGRNNDYEFLLNILFVVVMAAFWLVGTIVKSKIKTSNEEEKDKSPQKSARMPSSIGKAFWEQFIEISQNSKINQKQRMISEKKNLPVKATVSNLAKTKAVKVKEQSKSPQVSMDVVKEPSSSTISIPQMESIASMAAYQTSEMDDSFDISFDNLDADGIKRAIIYTEILGKPVSMRNLS